MSWKDRVAPATYNGVPFFLGTTEHEGGRRAVIHEYPQKDIPWGEDLGLAAKKFILEGYVIGDDYISARDALLDALDKPGPGELSHPFYGTVRVQLEGRYRVRESTQDGGMASFSMPFVVTSAKPAQPSSVVDGASTLQASAQDARDASETEFINTYTPGAKMDGPRAAFGGAVGAVASALESATADAQQAASLAFQVSTMLSSGAALVQDPAGTFAGLQTLVSLIDSVSLLTSLYSFDPGPRPSGLTPSRVQEQSNYDAMRWLVQRLAVVRICEVLSVTTFDVYDDAVSARDGATEMLDDQAENAADDTYPALLQLRADLVAGVPGTDEDLPRVVSYTPTQTVSSLVLAHRIYGDISQEESILTRNRVATPAFVRGGAKLQVLSNG